MNNKRKITLNEAQFSNLLTKIISESVKKILKEGYLQQNSPAKYTYEILDSVEDAKKWYKPTSPGAWCNTYARQHFDSYTKRYNGHFVVIIQDGWENIQRPKDPSMEANWTPEKPHDAYGNSLIMMLQSNTSPEPIIISSRWNHGYDKLTRCEGDRAYTPQELVKITGINLEAIYNDWRQNHKIKKRRPKNNMPNNNMM